MGDLRRVLRFPLALESFAFFIHALNVDITSKATPR